MKILITSGGTTEAIDSVRGITNHATGSLGVALTEVFLAKGCEVTLVTTQSALKPSSHPNLTVELITTVASLMNCLERLVPRHDVIVHSMAVSDYTPVYMTDIDELKTSPSIDELLTKTNQDKKISSQADVQVLFLKKTPKVISYIKKWNPKIRLVGFKLLVDVSQEELFAVARASLVKNQADYILANDLTAIGADYHHAYLIDEKRETFARTKQDIATLILERVLND